MPNGSTSTSHPAPQYHDLLRALPTIRSYRRLLQPQLVDRLMRETEFAPGQPAFERETAANWIVGRVLDDLAALGRTA